MNKRLAAQDWIAFALTTLTREGSQALKADILARKLGVTRGSFYWHFPDLGAFHAQVIEHWRQTATEAIITGLERYDLCRQRLDVLLRGALGHSALLEVRMRAWADENAEAARVLRDIDCRRRGYIEQLLVDEGIPPDLAEARAQLLYWTYLGAALSRTRLTDKQLDDMVSELKQIGLAPARPGVAGDTEQRQGSGSKQKVAGRRRRLKR